MDRLNLNELWATLIVEELVRSGVERFVIAPGSRSAPLAAAAARNPRARISVHFDERGAAFMALGQGLAGRPAAVVCTSGTAVANCFPAFAEACQSAVPLLVLSADRPPELQGCGANQTMEQHSLFGKYARAFAQLPCPDAAVPPEALLSTIDSVIARMQAAPGGPVHINCMFRELPDLVGGMAAQPKGYLAGLKHWQDSAAPYTQWEQPKPCVDAVQADGLARLLEKEPQGLLLLGRLYSREERSAALALAQRLQWPVFADITSGCRTSASNYPAIMHYDLLLQSPAFRVRCAPKRVLHIGDAFVSKRLLEHLQTTRPDYIHVSPRAENRDPIHRVTRRIRADVAQLCRQLTGMLPEGARAADTETMLHADRVVNRYIAEQVNQAEGFNELGIAATVAAALTSESALFLGNSMPVRDMDRVAAGVKTEAIYANRGVSGIDGTIATAVGMVMAREQPVVAVIGDMAALHDLNSMALAVNLPAPLVLIIINNGGGGIFSFLPIAAHTDVFETCFVNPHSWRFEQVAAMFGLPYLIVESYEALRHGMTEALRQGTTTLIEARTVRETNVAAHGQWYADSARRVEEALR